MSLSPGTRLGPFEVLSAIGAGGMGEVYKARDTKLNREVAIKGLPAAFARDAQRLARFQREAQVLAALNHPNIAAIYGLEENESQQFLVMEYVAGESMHGPVPVEEALALARQLVEALEAAHDKGIVHRDLKPDNIKVTPEGKVKVLDFGLAKAPEETSNAQADNWPTVSMAATSAGMILGTAAYMSPEQARGKPVDRRADVWGFGCVMYELLTGKKAFTGETITDLTVAIMTREPDWSLLPADTPPHVRELLQRCLQKDPQRRLKHLGDTQWEMDAPAPQTTLSVQPKPTRKTNPAWMLAAILLTAMAGIAAGIWWQVRRTAPSVQWTGVQLGGSHIAMSPRISPDGKTLAFHAMVDGQTQLAVMHPGSPGWTVLTHNRTVGAVDNICWSRDGTKIYFGRNAPAPTGIFSVPTIGGDERLLLEDAASPEILPDGSMIVTRINQGALQLHRFWPETGRVQALNAFPYVPVGPNNRPFPDGEETLYYGSPIKDNPPEMYALNLASGNSRPIATSPKLNARDLLSFPVAVEPDGRSFLTVVRAGDAFSIVRVPREGGSLKPLLSFTSQPSTLNIDVAGSLYIDQIDRPYEALRFPLSGVNPEHLGAARNNQPNAVLLPGDRTLLADMLGGRERLVVARPGKDPVPFVESDEETAGPMTQVGETEVAFFAGTGEQRLIAIASIADGRIRRRLAGTKGVSIDAMSATPDGKTIYYISASSVWSISATEEMDKPRKLAAAVGAAVTPDGRELVLLRKDRDGNKLSRLALATGVETAIPIASDLRIYDVYSGGVAADGRILICVCPVDSWFCPPAVLDPKTGKVTRLSPPIEADYPSISWTPDGRVFSGAQSMRATLWRFRPEKP